MNQIRVTDANFVSLSAVVLQRFWMVLVAAALAGAAAVYMIQLSHTAHYQAVAVVTLTDWQTERLTLRDKPNDKNPANVGGASADEMSRALVLLKSTDFFRSLPRLAHAEQLSVEHKRRGNLVTMKWNSSSAQHAETELALVVRHWDLRLREHFIQQKQQQRMTLQQLQHSEAVQQQLNQLNFELDYAQQAEPFALQYLQHPESSEQSLRPALWLTLVLGSLLGFSCAFILLMLWRL